MLKRPRATPTETVVILTQVLQMFDLVAAALDRVALLGPLTEAQGEHFASARTMLAGLRALFADECARVRAETRTTTGES